MPFTTSGYIISCQSLFPHLQVGIHDIVLVRPSINGGKDLTAQGLTYIQQALKTKESCLVKFHPSLKGCTFCLLFHRAIHEEMVSCSPGSPLSSLPPSFVLFSSSPPSFSFSFHYPYEIYYIGLGITMIHVRGRFHTYENTHS